MLRALLKKQALELGAFFYQSGKSGRRRSKLVIALYVLLMLYVAVVLCGMFYFTAQALCAPLVGAGMGWLYFAMMGVTATAVGALGSVFMAYSGLYQARDNELLLAMPIPTWQILFARMTGLYAMALLMEAAVLVPTVVVYQTVVGFNAAALVCGIALLFLLPLLAVVLSCLLGWAIALAAGRMRHRTAPVVLLSLGGIALYYYGIMRLNSYLQYLLVNSQTVGDKFQRFLYPLYEMGRAACGNFLSLLIFAALTLAVFALTCRLLERSFLRIATTKRGGVKGKYREGAVRVRSLDRALLGRELGRFWASPTYVLNCGLGSVFLLAGAVLALVKGDVLRSTLGQLPGLPGTLITCATVGFMAATAPVTAPSVSLEGRSLWVIQSLPVAPWRVLRAKLTVHLLVTGIPALVFAAVLCGVLGLDAVTAALTLAFSLLAVLLLGAVGLAANLKLPNLTWTNETVAVKQGASVLVTMLVGWGILFALAGLYFLAGETLGETAFLALCTALAAALALGLLTWLRRRGAAIFAAL